MKLADKTSLKSATPGFTLIEVLVALAFMALVVPIVFQCLHIATLAGEVSQRKALAARVAEKVLNETIVTGKWNLTSQTGVEKLGPYEFRWTVRNEPWAAIANVTAVNTPSGINQGIVNQNTLHEISVDVTYSAQTHSYSVHLTTLANVTQQVPVNTPPAK
jgi:type II secretion system protein I